MPADFVHLRLHTAYSLIDGVVRVAPLLPAVSKAGMPAVAMTDHCNLFALVKFYRAAMSSGIKPIAGVDLLINEGDGEAPSKIVLLCTNEDGYGNMARLVSRAYREGQQRGEPTVQRDWFEGATDGLIALSAARDGDIGQALIAGNSGRAEAAMRAWCRLFPDRFYVELHRCGRPGDEEHIHQVVPMAAALGVPVVATNDVMFLKQEDFDAHEIRVCIREGRTLSDPRRQKRYSDQQYLRTPAEMAVLFADIPEALENSVEIARRCTMSMTLGKNFLPDFPVPEGQTVGEFLAEESQRGLQKRLQELGSPDSQPYQERLAFELKTILDMDFPGYFLIVADFIRWAKANDVPVGPGRGSGAGSLVAYALEITDLDPLKYDLLFERFLNPERVSMPDFDVDFCMDGRDRVIEYVAQHYGRDRVSQIITYGTMAAKAVVRDVARVLGHPYGFGDRISKMIPFEVGMTLQKALTGLEKKDLAEEFAKGTTEATLVEKSKSELAQLYREDEEVRATIDMSRALEGLARNVGKHAGGVVIAPSKLTDFTPLWCEAGSDQLVSQFDKDDVEAAGLVKFDFLGLRTLTILDWAVKAINQRLTSDGEPEIALNQLPLDDRATYRMMKTGQTTAVFQLESRGMQKLIEKLRPDCFEDIVALVALFRPGPLQSGMVDDFIACKHGRQSIVYAHPDLEPILKPTYGIILYQEQVMQIAQVLAGYTLGGADMLRRAMGKKKPEEMDKQRIIFLAGSKENGIDENTATYIFDLMEKFAGYGFNKSHSAAYALLSFQTGYLKTHYPAEFMAAVLTADMQNTDKIVTLIEECAAMELKILPPDVNESQTIFAAGKDESIRYGLGAIKGVGEGALDSVIAAREADGPFHDIFDFCRRIELRKLNRRALETLIRSGALDSIGANRATLMRDVEKALREAEQHGRASLAGQDDLFGIGSAPTEDTECEPALPPIPEWNERERLRAEKEALGLFLSGHPVAEYQQDLARLTSATIGELCAKLGPEPDGGRRKRGKRVTLGGMVLDLRRIQKRNMTIATLDDRSGRVELSMYDETWEQYRELLIRDSIVIAEGYLSYDSFNDGGRLDLKELFSIDEARARFARRLVVRCGHDLSGEFAQSLPELLQPHTGGPCRVQIEYNGLSARGTLMLGEDWCVSPNDQLLQNLRKQLGKEAVEVVYGKARSFDTGASA